jgi:hypothetical protein
VTELENLSRFDHCALDHRAEMALATARELGLAELEHAPGRSWPTCSGAAATSRTPAGRPRRSTAGPPGTTRGRRLGLSGDLAARDRYEQVLQLGEELRDVDRQLRVLVQRSPRTTVSSRHP